ncbi:hypothetical protein WQ54_18210 [Bacillus sp. SA1-12]|uniref:YjcZ family sporulation protein n=1 Tax=Bacillus sp. SA1-12 TaxID=1455638 RepID=UPI000626EFBA|nr:YjcZ family sporulation protein [Bacillus sp. SA1-12]KKI90862.1 hypothetical protein WQ54_18210 [Bacillus sp. SA1-12]
MYGFENSPNVAGAMANAPHVAGVANAPHPVMPSYVAPAYGYCAPSYCNTFVLVVVLFILLIIIGATIYC